MLLRCSLFNSKVYVRERDSHKDISDINLNNWAIGITLDKFYFDSIERSSVSLGAERNSP